MNRILFVDDERKILDGIRRMLHADQTRWDMHFALSGEAALQACETAPFDVVISDVRMPGMDGATLLTQIRNRFPTTARIILSGYSDASLTMRAVPVAHRYIAKPCNATELRAMIERVCALRDILHTPEIQRIVGTIGELPSLSNSYAALAEAVQDPNTTIVGPAFSPEPYGMAISKAHPEFTSFVNGVLAGERADGTWTAIYNRWLGPVTSGPSPAPPPATYRSAS